VIDKADVRVSEFALPGPVLAGPLEELKKHPVPLFRSSRFYQYVCDLREPFGIDAVVHLYLRHGRPNHKVEIIDAGEKTVQEMADIIRQLFDVDPWTLQLMRADLATDLEGVSVPWFKNNAMAETRNQMRPFQQAYGGLGDDRGAKVLWQPISPFVPGLLQRTGLSVRNRQYANANRASDRRK